MSYVLMRPWRVGARIILLVVLTGVWLIPFFWAGWRGYLPVKIWKRLDFQYTAAALFTKRTGIWTQMLIQVQIRGSEEWQTLDSKVLSPMGAFGYRQRIDRILQETRRLKAADEVRRRMAIWVAATYDQQHPGSEVTGVRIGQVLWAANSPALAKPTGHWIPDPPMGTPLVLFKPFSAWSINHGSARRMP